MPTELRTLDELRIDKALDPRSGERSEAKIKEYAENLDRLPPIDIDQRNRILDGIHRYLAHERARRDVINVKIFTYEKEVDAVKHAYRANSEHGVPLTSSEIKQACIRLCELGLTNKQIAKEVNRHVTVVGKHVKETRERRENELANKVGQLYEIRGDNGKRIYTHKKLEKKLKKELKSVPHIGKLLDRYYANQIEARGLQGLSEAEWAEEFDITDKQVSRIVKDFGDNVRPPELEPTPEPVENEPGNETELKRDHHKEIQKILLWFGQMHALKLWLGKRERDTKFTDEDLAVYPNLLSELPAQLYSNVRKVIEDIDVLWLDGERIVAAFEVEDTSPIYSGLLRMSDLRLIRETVLLHVVAPHNRRRKVVREIERPTFKEINLRGDCKYIPYDVLAKKYDQAIRRGSLSNDWRAFLDEIAEDL